MQDAIFRVVAAILHLGNIDFVKGKEIDSSQLKADKSAYHLNTAAELLMYYSFSSLFLANSDKLWSLHLNGFAPYQVR